MFNFQTAPSLAARIVLAATLVACALAEIELLLIGDD
jgi:hypothetical protein